MSVGDLSGPEPYPPAPWKLRGRLWAGLFRAEAPVGLPAGLRHVLGSRWLVVLLVRYLDGTLAYDELALGSPARRGLRPGLFVHDMWVSDEQSVRGGREIWGLPKELATFDWGAGEVRIRDGDRLVAQFTMNARRPPRPPLPVWALAPFLGRRGGRWMFTVARLRAHPGGSAALRLRGPARFSFPLRARPLLSVTVGAFDLMVPAPRLLPD